MHAYTHLPPHHGSLSHGWGWVYLGDQLLVGFSYHSILGQLCVEVPGKSTRKPEHFMDKSHFGDQEDNSWDTRKEERASSRIISTHTQPPTHLRFSRENFSLGLDHHQDMVFNVGEAYSRDRVLCWGGVGGQITDSPSMCRHCNPAMFAKRPQITATRNFLRKKMVCLDCEIQQWPFRLCDGVSLPWCRAALCPNLHIRCVQVFNMCLGCVVACKYIV
jgi:hypothetical protein